MEIIRQLYPIKVKQGVRDPILAAVSGRKGTGKPGTTTAPKVKQQEGEDDSRPVFTVPIVTMPLNRNDWYTLNIPGIEWTNYVKNPVMLAIHQSNRWPIGTMLGTPKFTNNKRAIEIDFVLSQVNPEGLLVEAMILEGTIRAVSVGLNPLETEQDSDGRIVMKRSEILEVSPVSVPADYDALISQEQPPDRLITASPDEGELAALRAEVATLTSAVYNLMDGRVEAPSTGEPPEETVSQEYLSPELNRKIENLKERKTNNG